jgi:hypothetical protein
METLIEAVRLPHDFVRCPGDTCEQKGSCKRYLADHAAKRTWTPVFAIAPCYAGPCPHYLPVEGCGRRP